MAKPRRPGRGKGSDAPVETPSPDNVAPAAEEAARPEAVSQVDPIADPTPSEEAVADAPDVEIVEDDRDLSEEVEVEIIPPAPVLADEGVAPSSNGTGMVISTSPSSTPSFSGIEVDDDGHVDFSNVGGGSRPATQPGPGNAVAAQDADGQELTVDQERIDRETAAELLRLEEQRLADERADQERLAAEERAEQVKRNRIALLTQKALVYAADLTLPDLYAVLGVDKDAPTSVIANALGRREDREAQDAYYILTEDEGVRRDYDRNRHAVAMNAAAATQWDATGRDDFFRHLGLLPDASNSDVRKVYYPLVKDNPIFNTAYAVLDDEMAAAIHITKREEQAGERAVEIANDPTRADLNDVLGVERGAPHGRVQDGYVRRQMELESTGFQRTDFRMVEATEAFEVLRHESSARRYNQIMELRAGPVSNPQEALTAEKRAQQAAADYRLPNMRTVLGLRPGRVWDDEAVAAHYQKLHDDNARAIDNLPAKATERRRAALMQRRDEIQEAYGIMQYEAARTAYDDTRAATTEARVTQAMAAETAARIAAMAAITKSHYGELGIALYAPVEVVRKAVIFEQNRLEVDRRRGMTDATYVQERQVIAAAHQDLVGGDKGEYDRDRRGIIADMAAEAVQATAIRRANIRERHDSRPSLIRLLNNRDRLGRDRDFLVTATDKIARAWRGKRHRPYITPTLGALSRAGGWIGKKSPATVKTSFSKKNILGYGKVIALVAVAGAVAVLAIAKLRSFVLTPSASDQADIASATEARRPGSMHENLAETRARRAAGDACEYGRKAPVIHPIECADGRLAGFRVISPGQATNQDPRMNLSDNGKSLEIHQNGQVVIKAEAGDTSIAELMVQEVVDITGRRAAEKMDGIPVRYLGGPGS